MSHPKMSELSRSLIEIAWHLGPKGLNGECCENLSMPEFIALDKVATTKDCPVQNIGQALGFTKSGATKIVNRLESKEYIQRVKSLDDARVCCVVITNKGEEILERVDESYSAKFQDLLERMPQQYAPKMEDFFKAIAKALKS